ncbi:MAG: hypothetical protein HYW49_08740 [Deltaproteobacteria bacterium]|nr:hypothetical protein [Deltaproteobacteria bacterium]
MNRTRAVFLVLTIFLVSSAGGTAHAMGKKRRAQDTQAFPVRTVSVGRIYDTGFKLPDGRNQVNMQQALPILLATQIADGSDKIRVAALGGTPARYVISGGVTSFVAEVADFGVTFGYKPGTGDVGNGSLQGANGKVDVRIGELEMDFHVVDTSVTPNVVVVAKFASARDLGVKLEATMDFGDIDLGARFVYDSPVTKFFRRALKKIVERMSEDPQTNFRMDWEAALTRVDFDLKRVFFEAGLRDGIEPRNVFTVYDGDRRIGEIRVERAELDQSSAFFKDDADGRLLKSSRQGDPVRVFFKQAP